MQLYRRLSEKLTGSAFCALLPCSCLTLGLAVMEMFAQQMRDFTAAVIQQQQTAIQAMLNSERGRPAAQGVNEKYYKRVESFSGEEV